MSDRTIEDYDRLIARLEPMLRRCKRERKRLVTIKGLKERHADPDFVARLRDARQAAWDDPVKAAIRLKKFRATYSAKGHTLPRMSDEQRHDYHKMRRQGASRRAALKVIFPNGVAAATSVLDVPQTVEHAPVDLPTHRLIDRRTPIEVQ